MSYPEQAPARRPGALRLAVVVLAMMALGAFGYALAGLVTFAGIESRLRAAADGRLLGGSEIDAMTTLLRTPVLLSAVVSLIAGLFLAGLALGLAAGRSGARVGSWVVAGFGVLFGCCGLMALFMQRVTPLDLRNAQAAAELVALTENAYPSWWLPLTAALSVGQVLGYLVVATLLALPSVNAWFRRPAAPAPMFHSPVGPPPPAPHHPYPQSGAAPPPHHPPR